MLNERVILLFFIFSFYFNGEVHSLENSTTLYKKGAALAAEGKISQAIEIFKKVIKTNQYYALGHYGLGKAYLYIPGKLNEAIIHLRRSVILDRRLSKGYFYLGMAYLFANKLPRAATSFHTAYKLDETLVEALYNLGVVYDRMKNSYKAKFYYRLYLREKYREEGERIF
jgi:tetratricopeptide (TPR) repeat protein